MFQIGEFSRIARVSSRLLRYYDELGLLVPAHTDEITGYRAYTAAQLPTLNRILVLKELGLTLEQIAKVMQDGIAAAELRGMLLVRRAEAERALRVEADRLRQLETRIEQLETAGQLSDDDVLVRSEPACRVLTVRDRFRSFAEGKARVAALAASIPQLVSPRVLGRVVVFAHSPSFEPDDLDLEIGFFLERDLERVPELPRGELEIREVASVAEMAVCVRAGPPEVAHATTAQIGRFVEANGYRLAGPNREVFLQRPDPNQMQSMVVEMQFPIERVRVA
jgi:DNA-binding transcriptional MerR regulator/effector-binding domain-containing protein